MSTSKQSNDEIQEFLRTKAGSKLQNYTGNTKLIKHEANSKETELTQVDQQQ